MGMFALGIEHPLDARRLISESLWPNGPALTFQNRPILKQNLLGSTVYEPTSERCWPPPSRVLRRNLVHRGALWLRGL